MKAPSMNQESGLTLVELIIAITITAIAFASVFATISIGIDVQVDVRELSEAEMVGPSILAQVSADLRNIYTYNINNNGFFEGHGVESGDQRMDQVHCITTRPSFLADSVLSTDEEGESPSPLTEVSWVCRDGEGPFFELHRREQNFVDDDPFRGGYYRLVSDRVKQFSIQYTGWTFAGEGEDGEEGENGENGRNGNNSGNSNPNDLTNRNNSNNNSNSNSNRDSNGRDRNENTNENGERDPFNSSDDDEEGGLEWEDDWVSADKGGPPVAIKIELVISPDVDPKVMRRMQKREKIDNLDKSYVHIILLPNFREDFASMEKTFAWDGAIAEPEVQGGGAGGRGARGARGASTQTVGAGGRGRGQRGQRGQRGERGSRGQDNSGQLNRGGNRGNANNLINQLSGGRPAGGNAGGNNPFLNLLRNGGGGR